jgi:putative lysine transport system permease protein
MPETFFGWVIFLLEKFGNLILKGTANTLIIAVTGTLFGFLIGLLVAVARTIPIESSDSPVKKIVLRLIRWILSVYIEVFRGTPMIVQAMVVYYGALQYLNLDIPAMVAAVFIVSINTGSYMAEIIRGGIISVDKGQTEGAQSIGMTHWQTMTSVVLPQAIRNIIPSIGNEFIVNIKDSSVLNVISVSELFFMSKSAAGTYLKYFEVFFITGCIYLVLTYTISRLMRLLEKHLDGPDNFVIHGSQNDSSAEIHIKKRDGGAN